MYQFFDWLSIQRIPFDEYNNFRNFKVSYDDTKIFFLLLTLIRFHTSFGRSKLWLGNYLFTFFWIKLQSISTPMYHTLFSTKILQRAGIAGGTFFKKGVLEFVVKILDKYTNKKFLKIPF